MEQALIQEIVRQVMERMEIKNPREAIDSVEMMQLGLEEIVMPEASLLVPEPKHERAYNYMMETTPARIGVWRAGDRPMTDSMLNFRADHGEAVDAVFSTVPESWIDSMGWLSLQSRVIDKDTHLTRPDLGRMLDEKSEKLLISNCEKNPSLQIVISDGLSAKAVLENMKDLLPAFLQGLSIHGITCGKPVFVKYGRVGVMDHIGELLNAESAIIFVGERPGLATSKSLSAYMIYHPRNGAIESERTVLSNIHPGGTPAMEAGAHLADLMKRILEEKASGIF